MALPLPHAHALAPTAVAAVPACVRQLKKRDCWCRLRATTATDVSPEYTDCVRCLLKYPLPFRTLTDVSAAAQSMRTRRSIWTQVSGNSNRRLSHASRETEPCAVSTWSVLPQLWGTTIETLVTVVWHGQIDFWCAAAQDAELDSGLQCLQRRHAASRLGYVFMLRVCASCALEFQAVVVSEWVWRMLLLTCAQPRHRKLQTV